MNYQFPHSRGTPPGRPDVHQAGDSRSVRRQRLFAGGLAVCVAVAVIAFLVFGQQISSLIGSPLDRDVAPTSGRIAFFSDRDGDEEIYVMNADGSGVVQLTDNDSNDRHPAWHPDGTRIGFASNRGNDLEIYDLYVMNADGSNVQQLKEDGCHLAWSPEGDRIAFTSGGEIYVMNTDGSGIQNLTDNSPPSSGGSIFFADRDGDGYGEPYLRKPDGSFEIYANWDSGDWDAIDWDAINALNWDHIDAGASWSPDGGRITFSSGRDGDKDIYVMNTECSGVLQLTENEYYDSNPAWSPDGGRIAFSSTPDGDTGIYEQNIYVMNADGNDVVQLTDNDGLLDFGASWSPDGHRIAFASGRGGGDMSIYVMNADGSGVVQLTDNENYDSGPAWSPVLD